MRSPARAVREAWRGPARTTQAVEGPATTASWRRGRGLLPLLGRVLAYAARAVVAPLTLGGGEVGGRDRRAGWRTRVDVALGLLLYGLTASAFIQVNKSLDQLYPPQLLHLLAAGCCLPVAVRWRWPPPAWQVSLVSVVALGAWFQPLWTATGTAPFEVMPIGAYMLCLYAVASRHRVVVAVGAWLWSVAGILVVANAGPPLGAQAATVWTWSVAAVTLPPVFAHNVVTRRRAERALAEQERRSRREQAERARLEERSRIARELHDVVAHNMSVIAIQAEAAPLKAGDDTGTLAEELAGIRATALETLTEMRRVLDLLHTRDTAADTVPAPGVDQLDALVERVGAAGVEVDLTIAGTAHPVAPGVGVSVYRIVQESLSNALRHAPGAKVAVELSYRDAPRALVVRVQNGPPPAAPPVDEWDGARHGLVGMRERAAMLHGELRAQPTIAGGFIVEATLPLEAS